MFLILLQIRFWEVDIFKFRLCSLKHKYIKIYMNESHVYCSILNICAYASASLQLVYLLTRSHSSYLHYYSVVVGWFSFMQVKYSLFFLLYFSRVLFTHFLLSKFFQIYLSYVFIIILKIKVFSVNLLGQQVECYF